MILAVPPLVAADLVPGLETPSQFRAIVNAQTETVAADGLNADGVPAPSATIRLRNPGQSGGVIRRVDAGVAGGVKIVSGDEPVRISWPMTARGGRASSLRCSSRSVVAASRRPNFPRPMSIRRARGQSRSLPFRSSPVPTIRTTSVVPAASATRATSAP